jgi:hypothetical protein
MFVTSSTTGITGGVGMHRGAGVTRAIVRAGQAFRRYDAINYRDPNVPCNRVPIAQWEFRNANPTGGKAIYGWMPNRNPGTQVRAC